MRYVGIDLGTTNSAISSYDGENVQIFKSPEQHDVTPSAIYFDKRGNKYVGSRAYNSASRSPDNAALLFKRFMGTSTKVKILAVDMELTPEECSAEILKTLYGYLPEEIRNSDSTGTVITVPAAFNQMQKDATMSAAELAGIGKVALMQEPVAAVMSVMKSRSTDGIFLVYDLGGGTLDIAIAESISGKVNLLSHGGIAMCGGRDFDRALLDNIVKPWLLKNFNLPDDITVNPQFKTLMRMATWASEKAKIELSSREDVIISLPETELNVRDLDGEEIYIDIPITRNDYDPLIREKIDDSIKATREALEKAGLTSHDIDRVVFVGGPTQYKPLRDLVSFELGIAASTDVNPMTAVSEGAALFAESIDWTSQNRSRKKSKGSMSAGTLDLTFNYIARTPDIKAKVMVKLGNNVNGYEFQIDNNDTGWTSGKMSLENGSSIQLPLAKYGENSFKVYVFDNMGKSISLPEDKIIISRTAASIDAIPASNSIGLEVKDKVGGKLVLDYLVKEGDKLPAKGERVYKAGESLKAGSSNSIKFKLWEGEITDPVTDNNFIGLFEIKGTDFDSGVIPTGAELIAEYEMHDSGLIVINVSVPSIGNSFNSGRNFYSRTSGQIDYSSASKLVETQSQEMIDRVEQIEQHVDDNRLYEAKEKLTKAQNNCANQNDPEATKQAMDDVQEAKKILAQTRKDHLKTIRQMELDNTVQVYEDLISEYAKSVEQNKFDNLRRSAQRAIDNNSNDFESYLEEIRQLNFDVLWNQDWFIVDRFKQFAESPYLFSDQNEFQQLVNAGVSALKSDDISKLRQVLVLMYSIKIGSSAQDDIFASSNIIRGH
ncbi:Hsp70 family protein [Aliarcobacter cryaerophilus]|uniref:Hsp70 family protein n=1 Tax=Aliarcobacter cryaerophilus TaxID=28198 RepID=UPI0021B4AE7F|nr:Hsp70 family protein [Aliarcobacter cryaerophilus]MCT7433797.1 Hsp70 family protein [Aliarcobacter cryaerophilus]